MVLQWPGACTGGTHEETLLPAHSIMNGAPGLLAEAGVDFSIVQGEVV